MAWAPLAAAGVAAVGSLVSGVAQFGQARQQAAYAEQSAELAEDQAAAQAAAIREKAARARGSNIAAAGASGVTLDGSFADALTDNDINSELDAQTAVWNGALESANARSQARMSRSAGVGALFGGVVNAGCAALQGFGSWKLRQAMSPGATSAPGYAWSAPVGGHGGAR